MRRPSFACSFLAIPARRFLYPTSAITAPRSDLSLALTGCAAPAVVLGWSTSELWTKVSDPVWAALSGEHRLIQFACIMVVVGLFLLWWRK